MRRPRALAPAALLLALSSPATAQPCTGAWLRPFGEGLGGINQAHLTSLVTFDEDGPGPNPPAVFAAGLFTAAGGVPVANVARWNGAAWSAVGSYPFTDGQGASALAVFDDDGPGPHPTQLYLAGGVTDPSLVARWDGSGWTRLPAITNLPAADAYSITAMAVFDDDGAGPRPSGLYVAVEAYVPSFNFAAGIFRWDGTTWTSLPGSPSGTVSSMVVFTPPGGTPGLYVASNGYIQVINTNTYALSRWDGASFTEVAGDTGLGVNLRALVVLDDDGAGPHPTRLFAGGYFTSIGGVSAASIASYDGHTWAAVGTGFPNQSLSALGVHDPDGSRPAHAVLVAAVPRSGGSDIQQWDGASWQTLGAGFNSAYPGVTALLSAVLDDAGSQPPRLFAGGSFSIADNRFAHNIAYWDSTTWRAVGNSLDNAVHALLPIDNTPLPRGLYAAGAFATADGSSVGIARWDGAAWSGLGGPGANNHVDALLLDRSTNPPALVAAGKFNTISGTPANHIAAWNGSSWYELSPGLNGNVRALSNFTDASGPALFAAGDFVSTGANLVHNIARWNGASWSALGPAAAQGTDAPINALAVFNSALYAAGEFTHAGGIPANHIARWNGSSWSPLSSGTDGTINALAAFDDGSGPALFATGQFSQAGGSPANHIARWNGTSWSPLGTGLNGPGQSLSVFDLDGPGPLRPALFVGGAFTTAGGATSGNLARWDGLAWTPVNPGIDNAVLALAPFDADGPGPNPPALYIGGWYAAAGGSPAPNLAALSACTVCYANCDSSSVSPILNVNDFLCFQLKFASGDPYANCDGSTTPPILNINDFACFQTRFAQGCP